MLRLDRGHVGVDPVLVQRLRRCLVRRLCVLRRSVKIGTRLRVRLFFLESTWLVLTDFWHIDRIFGAIVGLSTLLLFDFAQNIPDFLIYRLHLVWPLSVLAFTKCLALAPCLSLQKGEFVAARKVFVV